MNYTDAIARCEFDGAYLAYPRSEDENAFIASLIPNQNIWIGVNDIDEEGNFTSVHGFEVSYTKWYTPSGQPDNFEYDDGFDEDGVQIIWSSDLISNGFWNDLPIKNLLKFVCSYDLTYNPIGNISKSNKGALSGALFTLKNGCARKVTSLLSLKL